MEAGAIIALAALILTFAGTICIAVWKLCGAMASLERDIGCKIRDGNTEIHRRINELVSDQARLANRVAIVEATCKQRHVA